MTYNIRNVRWVDVDSIDVEWEHPVYGWIPFTAHENDVEDYGREIFAQAKPLAGPFVPSAVPKFVPNTISDRQFFQQLAVSGLITEAEAIAAVATGAVPAAMEAFIVQLPESNQFAARMLLQGATTFQRSHPLTDAFGALYGMSPDQIDDLWIAASQL